MNSKGNYYAGNLACQNLGDCSLCDLTIMPEETETISLQGLLKKLTPESAA